MIVPPHAELHYRTRVVLRSAALGDDADGGGVDDPREIGHRVGEAIRAWVTERFPDPGETLAEAPFHEGRAEFVSLQPSGQVRTLRSEIPDDEGSAACGGEIWGFQARFPDGDVGHREWAHEVAVAPMEGGGLRVSVRLHHWLEVGDVGLRAPRPEPGPPDYVMALSRIPGVEITDGRDPLPLEPVPVRLGDGPAFVEHLADPERRVGVVYLSATRREGRPAIDPEKVARAVALEGVVRFAESPDLDSELDHFLSQDLRCYGGALRIYRPGLDPRARGRRESDRHRYIPWRRLSAEPERKLLSEIAGELAKAMPLEDPRREPVTFEEIDATRIRREIAELREETETLRERSRGGLSAEDASKLFRLSERLEERVRTLEEDNQRLARRAFHASEQLEEERQEPGLAADTAPPPGELDPDALVAALRELPGVPADALELASHLFPHRLLVTDRARDAATGAPTDDAAMAWRILVAMAEVLHPLHFDDEADSRSALEIREGFRNRTRFDLGLTESKSTKASDRLRALRTLEYEGRRVELLWHVKWGSRPPGLLRVYYHPDRERRLLVIGWFGDHLETAGTRRM